MSTRQEIDGWVSQGEHETQEFKKTTGQRSDAAKAACAFSNHRGGRILFGVDPQGHVLGQDVNDKTLEDVIQELSRIDPPILPVCDRIQLDSGKTIIAVRISPGGHAPYRYAGRAFRRVGNTNKEMTIAECERMLLERLHSVRRWETEVAEGWSLEQLDTSEITRTLEESIRRGRQEDPGTRDPGAILKGFGLIKEGRLLRAAVVLFAKPDLLLPGFPQCVIRLARFRGKDKTEFVDNRQYHGNAFDLLLRADRFLRDYLPVAGRVVPDLFERVDDPIYPPVALREALANAVCHRDYSIGGGSVGIAIYDDRLEISSSGALPFGLRVEELFGPHESRPWNPAIAQVFYRRGIIEMWGRGTTKIAELTQKAGLPTPEIEEIAGALVVRFRPGRYVPPLRIGHDLTDRQQKILAILGEGGRLSVSTILKHLQQEVPRRSLYDDLGLLRSLGLIESASRGRGARWFLKGKPR